MSAHLRQITPDEFTPTAEGWGLLGVLCDQLAQGQTIAPTEQEQLLWVFARNMCRMMAEREADLEKKIDTGAGENGTG